MTEEVAEAPEPALRERFGSALDRVERVYLKVLRAAILIIATGLLLYAAWLGVWSLWKMAQSPDSVVEQPAFVAADELTDAEMPVRAEAQSRSTDGPKVDPAQQRYYSDFVKRYFALYSSKFEPYRQKDDKQLSRDQFDDAFVKSNERLQAAAKGDLNFAADRTDLETLLAVMTEAAGKPQTQQRLQQYKAAKKVSVARKVQRTRTETREGWDRYGYDCIGWDRANFRIPGGHTNPLPDIPRVSGSVLLAAPRAPGQQPRGSAAEARRDQPRQFAGEDVVVDDASDPSWVCGSDVLLPPDRNRKAPKAARGGSLKFVRPSRGRPRDVSPVALRAQAGRPASDSVRCS